METRETGGGFPGRGGRTPQKIFPRPQRNCSPLQKNLQPQALSLPKFKLKFRGEGLGVLKKDEVGLFEGVKMKKNVRSRQSFIIFALDCRLPL
jgi:hypothetical protein